MGSLPSFTVKNKTKEQSQRPYLGILRHRNEYGVRRKYVGMISQRVLEYVEIKGDCLSLRIRRDKHPRKRTLERIDNGEEYWEPLDWGDDNEDL